MPLPSRTEDHATPADRAACRQAIRQGSRSFHLAGRLLPVEIREPAFAVYAFCRMADDMVDGATAIPTAIAEIEHCLDRVYSGRPRPTFVERAFADAVRDHAIPRVVPEALVDGLRWDAEGRRCRTLSDLRAYAVRVAGSVGVMMSLVMHRRDPDVLARACDLGIAMQITNVCRDVGEDARAGRLYLPEEMLLAAGLPAEVPPSAVADPAYRRVIDALLAEAERHYDRAAAGIAELPAGSRLGINAARFLYREIGRMVGSGVDPMTTRAVVPGRRKLALLAASARLPAPDRRTLAAPCAAEAAFLVEAVAREVARPPSARLRWWDVPGRTVRLVEMLAAFEPGRPPVAGEASLSGYAEGERR
jgi:phytoene synthase